MEDQDPVDAKSAFELRADVLSGRRVLSVQYWDIHNFGQGPARWDYGEWHHAVMGVQLDTDAGPVTITWTNAFHPYGIEVFDEPITRHLVLGDSGPERVGSQQPDRWATFLGTPVVRTRVWWETLNIGPGRLADGSVASAAQDVELPTAVRVDFEAGPVWFVAAIPQPPDMTGVFIPGDEVMVVFSAAKMRQIGYEDPQFTAV